MTQEISKTSIRALLSNESIKHKFNELLGKKAPGFISSVLSIVNSSSSLSKAEPKTVLNAAATAAALDLPINPSLGYAWIVPYKGKAQFQIGWKGLVQLAIRTGLYRSINVIEIYDNQFEAYNTLTEELDVNMSLEPEGEVVGYAAHFKLVHGFEKTVYWSKEKVKKHAKKYSKTYSEGTFSPWNDEDQFDAMAKKTVLKNTLSKWGIMSIELQTANQADQSIQRNEGSYEYPDNDTDSHVIDITENNEKLEKARIVKSIAEATNVKSLQEIEDALIDQDKYEDSYRELIEERKEKLISKEIEMQES